MIVVPHHAGDIALFGDEAVAGGTERDAAGGAAILHGDERNTRQPEPCDEVVRLGLAIRAARGELDIAPGQAAVGERPTDRLLGEVLIIAVESAECGA